MTTIRPMFRLSLRPAVRSTSWLTVVVSLFLPGCTWLHHDPSAPLVLGEHVAYRLINKSRTHLLQMPTLSNSENGEKLFATLRLASAHVQKPMPVVHSNEFEPSPIVWSNARASSGAAHTAMWVADRLGQDPSNQNLSLPAIAVGVPAVMSHGHRVPESVSLSWREQPKPGQAHYRGSLVGPVLLPMRSRLPASVLARVRDQWRYRLDIDVIATADQPEIRWRVLCFSEGSLHEIERGGRW